MFEDGKKMTFGEVLDGLSNTMWLLEGQNGTVHWAEPKDFDISQLGSLPQGNHPGGNIAGMGDGSVRFLSKSIDPVTLKSLLTRAGGEPIQQDF